MMYALYFYTRSGIAENINNPRFIPELCHLPVSARLSFLVLYRLILPFNWFL